MEKQLPAYTNILYYLIVVFVIVGLLWAHFLPVELSIPGQGYVAFLGEPNAVTAPVDGTVKTILAANAAEVRSGEKILTALEFTDDLSNNNVIAPIPGILLWQRDFVKGDRIREGERLALIYPSAPVGIKVNLPEKDLGRVERGMPVRVQLPAYPSQIYGVLEGVVQERVLKCDPMSGRDMEVAVLISFEKIPNSRIRLSPGLSASVEIVTGKTSLLKKLLF